MVLHHALDRRRCAECLTGVLDSTEPHGLLSAPTVRWFIVGSLLLGVAFDGFHPDRAD